MLGFLRRVTSWWPLKGRYLAGFDLNGNRFYEYPGRAALTGRTRRVVEYRKRLAHAEYVHEQRNLPVQWQAWLSRQREIAPSLEELQNDRVRVTQLTDNVAQIAERDMAERERAAAMLAAPAKAPEEASIVQSTPSNVRSDAPTQPATQPDEPVAQEAEKHRKRELMNQSPLTGYRPVDPSADEPVGWKPSAPRRRGGQTS